jgi:hypothetical protein
MGILYPSLKKPGKYYVIHYGRYDSIDKHSFIQNEDGKWYCYEGGTGNLTTTINKDLK